MTEHKKVVNIGDSDQNADWIKTPKNKREEAAIHAALAKQHGKEKPKGKAEGKTA